MAPPNLVLTTRDLTIKEKLNRSPLTRQEDEKFRAKWITLIKHSQNSKQRVPHETVRGGIQILHILDMGKHQHRRWLNI